ncbi:MAG: hypothetical protein COY40_02505, partial [Alphaproteobacteria bacterium CG_4_10_14_0_8_um_filter_53_9]
MGLFGGLGGTVTGASGGATGDLAGIFASLVGTQDANGVPMDAEALLEALKNGELGGSDAEGNMAELLAKLLGGAGDVPTSQSFPLAEGLNLDVVGGQVDVAMLQIRLTEITVTLRQNGINLSDLQGPDDYAAALVVLGMDPAEAAAKAEALDVMMAYLEKKLGIESEDTDAESGMLALMMAGMIQPLPLGGAVTVTL